MGNVGILRVNRPALLENLATFYYKNLSQRISIEEIVGMMVFIEYFAIEEDRNIIRSGFLQNLNERFSRHDLGRHDMQGLIVDVIANRAGIDIHPHMLNRAEAVYVKDTVLTDIDPTIKPKTLHVTDEFQRSVGGASRLNQYQKYHQNKFLEICDYIEKIYNAIRLFYLNSGHHKQLLNLVGNCYGGIPKISSSTCTHIDIQVVFAEVF